MTNAVKTPDQPMATRIVAQTDCNARKTNAQASWKHDLSKQSESQQKKSVKRGGSENGRRDGEQKGGRIEAIKCEWPGEKDNENKETREGRKRAKLARRRWNRRERVGRTKSKATEERQ
jgi:hypothetical protein